MTIDTQTAIEASETWKRLAGLVATIELYLEPRRSKSEVRMPPASKPPIDLVASDLLMELDIAASFYVSALCMETKDIKRFPDGLSAQLGLIGERHGHFTSDADEKIAMDFCDEAHELMRKVERLVVQPAPPSFMGPCLTACGGDLWLRQGRVAATCDQCGSDADLGSVREQLSRALESRLMRRTEIAPAIKLLGGKVTNEAIKKWVQRGRLVPVVREPELFRLTHALDLAHLSVSQVAQLEVVP